MVILWFTLLATCGYTSWWTSERAQKSAGRGLRVVLWVVFGGLQVGCWWALVELLRTFGHKS